MKKLYRRAFEAGILTFGLAACMAALAAGHADDAPGVGLIGLEFSSPAPSPPSCPQAKRAAISGSPTPPALRRDGTSVGNHVANSGVRR